jgi:putative endonuclease
VSSQAAVYYVYVLKSLKDGKLYKGMSRHPQERLKQHNAGKVRATKVRKPFTLVYQRAFNGLEQAREHEVFLKTPRGGEWLARELRRDPRRRSGRVD